MGEEKKILEVSRKKFSISTRIKSFFEKRRTERFYKYARGREPEDREKALKQWSKLSESFQMDFLRYYTTICYTQSGNDIILNRCADRYGFYDEKSQEKLIDDLWKNSNYNVQKDVAYNMQQNRIPRWSDYTVNINWHVVWRNIGSTDPRLQKQFLEELLNGNESDSTFLCLMENVTSDTEGWTRLRLTRAGKADLFRARVILKYMGQIDPALLLEMFDGILKVFDGTTWDNEMVKNFVSKIPKNIKTEKIDTTFDYAVRDDNLFAKKWEGLSYSEQIGALRYIFQECIFEQKLIDFREERETNLVRKMYPDYKYVSAANEKLMRRAAISYDPKVIKRIIGTLRGDDIEKYLMEIIEMKKAAPYTIYYIWNSLDKRVQAKYYDQVMAMLEGEPKTQYQLWIATRTNSQNQRKKLVSIIERIQEIGDIENLRSEMRFLVKGVSKDKKGGREQKGTLRSNGEKEI